MNKLSRERNREVSGGTSERYRARQRAERADDMLRRNPELAPPPPVKWWCPEEGRRWPWSRAGGGSE